MPYKPTEGLRVTSPAERTWGSAFLPRPSCGITFSPHENAGVSESRGVISAGYDLSLATTRLCSSQDPINSDDMQTHSGSTPWIGLGGVMLMNPRTQTTSNAPPSHALFSISLLAPRSFRFIQPRPEQEGHFYQVMSFLHILSPNNHKPVYFIWIPMQGNWELSKFFPQKIWNLHLFSSHLNRGIILLWLHSHSIYRCQIPTFALKSIFCVWLFMLLNDATVISNNGTVDGVYSTTGVNSNKMITPQRKLMKRKHKLQQQSIVCNFSRLVSLEPGVMGSNY